MASNFINPTGREALNDHKVDALTTKNNNLNMRRVTNAAPAINSNDYVIKSQVDSVQSGLSSQLTTTNRNLNKANYKLSRLVSYGLHSERLAMQNPPDGAVFFETDNGNIEYQYQNNAWVLVSGSLGTILSAQASVALTLTTSYTAVLGTSISITVPGTYLVIGTFYFTYTAGDLGFVLEGNLNIAQPEIALFGAGGVSGLSMYATISQNWVLSVSTVPTSLNLVGMKNGGSGASTINGGSTGIVAILL